ncbi:MAG: YceI family protein [Chloroflexi bacterium]|nr:MAG: YceI family protein [Chloroflexota bacterium]
MEWRAPPSRCNRQLLFWRSPMAVSTQLVRIVDGSLVPVPGVWEFDAGHTEVGFEGRHLTVARVRGRFTNFSGRLIVAEIPEESIAELDIDATSIESGFKDRDEHLKSADWFDVGRYPAISFRSRAISHVSGNRWKSRGELTIKEMSRPVDVDVEFAGAVSDPWGNPKIGAMVRSAVDREAWGLVWNLPLDAGGFVVGRTIHLTVDVEAVLRGPRQ